MGETGSSNNNDADIMDIPDYAYQSMVACLLPIIRKYYETDEGKRAFEEWKAHQNSGKESATE